MRRALFNGRTVFFAALVMLVACSARAGGQACLQKLIDDATSENSDTSKVAISALRSMGPAGLEALVSANRAEIEKHVAEGTIRSNDPEWQRLLAALDSVAGQHSCYASHLFWYTDLDAAKKAAKESGKPILSLRLLGNLTDEFSCANSRFFRTTLYSNAEVSRMLRDRFVLHWQSVRPVPRVTIDFGDGRKLERTLTGNSIHYVLDSDGRVVDALPGLYGPQAFMRVLQEAEGAVADIKPMDEAKRAEFLQAYHRAKANQLLVAWQGDLEKLGLTGENKAAPTSARGREAARATPVRATRAVEANRIARPKEMTETPILAGALADATLLTSTTDDAAWGRIAQLHQADAALDAASIAMMRAQNPNAARAGALSISKRAVEDPMLRLVRTFENTIAIDTVRNEYTFRRQIHEWLASGQSPLEIAVNDLNHRVYAELFLTPSNDPWLGLVPGDVYTALENNGVAQAK